MQLNKATSRGWCVYDVKFKWSTTDSQLWLKTVTVAPSLMKEELGFFQSGPSSMLGTVRGNEYRTYHNFSKGFSSARTPAPMHTSATSQVRGDQPRIRCSVSFESDNQPLLQLGIPTVSIIAPATAASNFGGVVNLHSHRDINKYIVIVNYYTNALLSSSSLLSLLLFFYYYYYHFFLGGCRFKKTFQKTTFVKDNVKVNIILFYFFFVWCAYFVFWH